MHEPSDGIAEEVERQLQLALAAAAVTARRASAARQHAIAQAQHDSAQSAHAVRAQIEAERRLAAARVQPVFDPGWWETAGPPDVADMWQRANSWRELDAPASTPTIFDHAANRIGQEVRDRTGLDVTQLLAIAAVQLEHEQQATIGERDPARQPADLEAATRDPLNLTRWGLTIPSAASGYAHSSQPPACPSRRSTREHSPTSAKPKSPPRPRTPPQRPHPDRGPRPAEAPAANYSASVDLPRDHRKVRRMTRGSPRPRWRRISP
jgi:hypothetical protein